MARPPGGRRPIKIHLDYITFRLDVINERLKALAAELYERECGINLREVRLLRIIAAEPGLTLARLIEHACLERTLASKAVTALVGRGLVVRSVGIEDARNIHLELTDEGVDVVMSAEPIGRLATAVFRAAFTDDEHEVFQRCLQKLADAGDDIVKRREAQLKAAARRAA